MTLCTLHEAIFSHIDTSLSKIDVESCGNWCHYKVKARTISAPNSVLLIKTKQQQKNSEIT